MPKENIRSKIDGSTFDWLLCSTTIKSSRRALLVTKKLLGYYLCEHVIFAPLEIAPKKSKVSLLISFEFYRIFKDFSLFCCGHFMAFSFIFVIRNTLNHENVQNIFYYVSRSFDHCIIRNILNHNFGDLSPIAF